MARQYEIRELRDEDAPSVLATFNEVFRREDPARPERTMEEWDWAYRRNPAGRRAFVALEGGRVVAQYAAQPYRVWIDGGERVFAHVVDSMVHPDHRAGLKRPGLFVQTALPFFEAYGGPEKDWVHYGWPVEAAWRIGKTFLGYEVVRTQTLLAWEPVDGPLEHPPEVETIERFDEQARWLWDRCAAEWGASAIRDAAFLNWRFAEHPRHDYTVFGVRDGEGVLRGYAVYRFGDWAAPRMGIVADWLVPAGEPEVGELLLRALLARARRDLATTIGLFVPDWSPWFARFQDAGFLVRPTAYYHGARSFHPRFDAFWLKDHWWYQIADSDLA